MATQPDKTPEPTDTVVVVIAVDNHEHSGIAIPNGGKIEVDRETAAWMLQNHIIEG